MENKIDELKGLLNQELQKEKSDNSIILSLSHKIADLDEDNIRFSVDAGVIDRLGKELVARQETAVSELVKNSYDADSTEVTLTFIDSDDVGGSLRISDNGDGMNRDELINGFMKISSTSKVHNPISRNYKRIRAGKKGIGRFAVHRLGKRLTIITQTKDSENALRLVINWDDYKKDSNLLTISNLLEIIPKEKENGTKLLISDLRDKWSTASVKRIYRYVSDIIQPYSLSEDYKLKNNTRIETTNDPGFITSFIKKNEGKLFKVADETTEIFDHALAKIEGWIDNNGKGIYSIISPKQNIDEIGEIGKDHDNPEIPFDKLRKIQFRAYYFLIDTENIPKLHITHIRRFLKQQGSIRLYRNGFRVLPYGEPGDDWLKLDSSLRTRRILPSHGNNNFYGFVEMTDENDVFTETSSREGLADGDELTQLQNFIYRILLTGVIKVAESRNVKVVSGQQKDEEGNWESVSLRINNIVKSVEELDEEYDSEFDTPDRKRKRKKNLNRIKDKLKELEEIQKSEETKYIKERAMLRVLSSVGLSIAQFIHEIKYYMLGIRSDINFLVENLQHDSNALSRVLILKENFSTFNTYTSYFDNVVSKNVIRELTPLDMKEVVTDFRNSLYIEAERSGIEFLETDFPIFRIFTKPMHPSEWASILFNLYTNSKKAIKRANSIGVLSIDIGETDNIIFVEFSDNGDGISNDIEEKIFDEFFTTTTANDFASVNYNTEILGTGLGLKIVKDIVKSYRGKIYVVSPKENFSTTIRIEVPMASDKDYEKYGL